MQTLDELNRIRRCVGFVVMPDESGKPGLPIGTVFFVSYPRPGGGGYGFMVTAKHVLAHAHNSGRRSVIIRYNTITGGVAHLDCPIDNWAFHPDETEADDYAVYAGGPSPETADIGWIGSDTIDTDGSISASLELQLGDEVFITGLFIHHSGSARNLPIVRTGSVAAMREEPIRSRIGLLDAYLIESRSVGGLSGSPVFANFGMLRLPQGFGLVRLPEAGSTFVGWVLIGMIHGHFDLSPAPSESEGLPMERVNAGIAIVPPIERAWQIIEHVRATRGDQRAICPS